MEVTKEVYQITCNKEQLKIISQAIECWSRRLSGQLDSFGDKVIENLLWNLLDKVPRDKDGKFSDEEFNKYLENKELVNEHLKAIKNILFPEFARYPEASYGYNNTPDIGNSYQIYRTIEYVLAKEREAEAKATGKEHGYDCYLSPALPSGNLGTIKVEKIEP